MPEILTLADVERAAVALRGQVLRTPCLHSVALSELTGNTLFLKFENRQRTGSFKERGACHRLGALGPEERARGVVAASAGNHAQAVAFHAARLGIPAVTVVPETTPLVKLDAVRRFGAEVELYGTSYDGAAERAAALAAERGLVLIHPFEDPLIMAGQGTIGLELVEDVAELDAIVVPVGGGGLLAGIACAAKQKKPSLQVYGVESRSFPGMQRALSGDVSSLPPRARTIADGIAVRRVGDLTGAVVRRYADDVVLVEEDEIAEAILLLLEREKTVVEGAGAVGLAALVHGRLPLAGKTVAVVLSGGNIDVNLMARVIERGLVKSGRLSRLALHVPDAAGTLAEIARVVASLRANVLAIDHDRAFSGDAVGETLVELVLETHGFEHIERVMDCLREHGFAPRIVVGSEIASH